MLHDKEKFVEIFIVTDIYIYINVKIFLSSFQITFDI